LLFLVCPPESGDSLLPVAFLALHVGDVGVIAPECGVTPVPVLPHPSEHPRQHSGYRGLGELPGSRHERYGEVAEIERRDTHNPQHAVEIQPPRNPQPGIEHAPQRRHAAVELVGLPQLGRRALAEFVADLLEAGAEPATARSRYLSLRRFSAWLVEERELPATHSRGRSPQSSIQRSCRF
jgi:hypothetical protein